MYVCNVILKCVTNRQASSISFYIITHTVPLRKIPTN